MRLQTAMTRDWDERARKNAFHYIASWRNDWDLPSFLASGEQDYVNLVVSTLERSGIAVGREIVVELGCGAGRMTSSFARRYRRVLAIDVSGEMLARARQIHAAEANILWLRAGGLNLSCLASNCTDFVFSYLVLQHLPNRELVFSYIREILRVLKPGGAFLFQFNGSRQPTMNLRGRLAWGVIDALWSARLFSLSRKTAEFLRLDSASIGKSWRGVAIPSAGIAAFAQSAGGKVLAMPGEGTTRAWCCGVKTASA